MTMTTIPTTFSSKCKVSAKRRNNNASPTLVTVDNVFVDSSRKAILEFFTRKRDTYEAYISTKDDTFLLEFMKNGAICFFGVEYKPFRFNIPPDAKHECGIVFASTRTDDKSPGIGLKEITVYSKTYAAGNYNYYPRDAISICGNYHILRKLDNLRNVDYLRQAGTERYYKSIRASEQTQNAESAWWKSEMERR